jgi:thiol-disulfide isomerase/thioredoxin
MDRMTQSLHAPQLESPLGWLNTDKPLRLDGNLRGHVVVLDFWTYCCINCIHILPDLKYLEHKYAGEPLVVIGVHSAKFANESSPQTISAAIHRYEIDHPVIVDDQMKLWREYAVRSWPTFVVIDPEGYVANTAAGEGNRELLDTAVGQLLATHREKGTLASARIEIRRDATVAPASGLAFPGKILADPDGKRIFVADSNHNRIVATTWPDASGRCTLIKTVGSGCIGADDGSADSATFDHPQGLALSGDTLYVADTENHTIRAIDLNTWQVTTVIGTGKMGNDRAGGAMGTQQEISSPWDLDIEGGTLYIAMAGIHQIWRAEMPIGFARALAGSGRENIVDGRAESAALSQPSGLCLHGGKLYFADSEVSAVRGVDLASEEVFTIIGQGLFVFGDVDGPHPSARLQHCLGVTPWHNKLLVADTYNHKVKLVDPDARTSETLFGSGQPAAQQDDGQLAMFEPGGLDCSGDDLFVADTNNHRIIHIDLTTREWRELMIEGLSAPVLQDANHSAITVPAVMISRGKDITFDIKIDLPRGAHLNPDAPWTIRVATAKRILAQQTGFSDSWPVSVTVDPESVGDAWDVSFSFIYCTESDGSLCIPADITWHVPVKPSEDGDTSVSLIAAVQPPA